MPNSLILNSLRGMELWLDGKALEEIDRQIQALAGEAKILIIGERGTEKEAAAKQIAYLASTGDFSEDPCLICYLQKPEDLEDISFLNHAVGKYVVFADCAFFSRAIQDKLKLLLLNNQLDLKFIFLTSAKLRPLVVEGKFDEELYRLILGKELYLPSLPERENFAGICQRILESLNKQYGYKVTGFSPETLIALSKREWPGNIEQLRAVIYLLAARTKSGIISQLP